jgi:uncharacterized delta-60 repeat protein
MLAPVARCRRIRSLLTAAVLFASSTLALAAAGDLDTSFGDGGVVITDTNVGSIRPGFVYEQVVRILVQPDGKVVTAGHATRETLPGEDGEVRLFLSLVRYNVDGSLDPSFGSAGIVRLSSTPHGNDHLGDAVLLPNGTFLVAASSSKGPKVARLLADGSLDPSFGKRGWAKAGWKPGSAESLVPLPDGRVLLFGFAGKFPHQRLAIARLDGASGKLDKSFGVRGVISDALALEVWETVQAKLQIVDGQPRFLVYSQRNLGTVEDVLDGVLLRFREDGTLDTSFGSGGMVALGPIRGDSNFAFDPQGGIVTAAGREDGDTPPSEMAGLVRLTRDGALDPTFGDGGFVRLELVALRVAVDPTTAKIAAAGFRANPDGSFTPVVARLISDGSADETFGQGGIVEAPTMGALSLQTVTTPGGSHQRLLVGGQTGSADRLDQCVAAFEW